MTRPHLHAAALLALAAVAGAACGGYDALPVRTRAFAPMTAVLLDTPSRLGATRVELHIEPPQGVPDFPWPWVVVGHPALQSSGGRVLAWARGPCDLAPGAAPPPGPPWIICAAVRWSEADTPPEAPLFTAVLEAVSTGQRVTFIGDTVPDGDASEPEAP